MEKNVEKELVLAISNLIKKRTGRGPKQVKVKLEKTNIYVTFSDFLSQLEISFLKFKGNPNRLNEIRRLILERDTILWETIERIAKKEIKEIKIVVNVEENFGEIFINIG
ncbi:Uncharacterized conserved protein [Anaerobranca californiensis DSM 14826]|jgi:uncharacterized protein YbcI|uniref:Uncharacterized conserved protein n=1 Tax=Anaerobranca californiensis DSM 14826 TaxID=1120989 RepID=A0A1M6LLR1_9FIRM|nr:Na-translocating system protein MpsC family protein [Anaerobranca californiensis]SHJ72117.1 Uncharacterized conserved protein [Anaerobranca californiensis DSM 14826]